MKKQKIIVILGQTATGKSAIAVRLAKKISGEIVSADSRQIYKGLDIGTGKITKKEMSGIPHHMLDIASPKRIFTAAEYTKIARKKIAAIAKRKKIPIVVGGTGFYIDTLLGKIALPAIPPNKKLREKLKNKTITELFEMLKKIDSQRARAIDKHNPVRLIRAIELAKSKFNSKHSANHQLVDSDYSNYKCLKIGLKIPNEKLRQKITIRLFARIRKGMIAEAKRLHSPPFGRGLSWKRMEELGLEYRFLAQYLRGKTTKEDMVKRLNAAIWQYAKRQNTWFKRDKEIHWFTLSSVARFEPKEHKKIFERVNYFLKMNK